MGFRRFPGAPPASLTGGMLETSLRLLGVGWPDRPEGEETEFPAIDVFETSGEMIVEAELPGVDPVRITVSAGEGALVIEGTKDEDPAPGRVNYLCMERTFGAFRRVVLAGRAVDLMRATAAYRDGILQVRVPKIEEKRGLIRNIPVSTTDRGERSEP